MTFVLSDSLKTDLLKALENQAKTFVVNAESGILEEGSNVDDEKYYGIPEWTSEDGFNLRKEFAESVRSPLVHDELMEVLHSGRGVFRNFKESLKQYPEIEKLWHKFKNQKMLEVISDWYNSLREVWGLEKMDQIPESDETLVHDDFSFEEFDSDCDKNKFIQCMKEIRLNAGAILDGSNSELPADVISAFQNTWQTLLCTDSNGVSNMGTRGFICHSLSDEFAGCILIKPVNNERKNVILVTNFFVSDRFRGLGIGTELLSMCVSALKSDEEKWLVMPNFIIPETIKPLLVRTGFSQIDFGFLLHI